VAKHANRYGVAFDVGTTTLVGALVDIESGRRLAARSMPNPQARCAPDVLGRARAIAAEPAALERLTKAVIGAMNAIMDGLAADAGLNGAEDISSITAAGNTVMEHILLGISPEPLGKVPYKPVFREAKSLPAVELGLKAAPDAALYAFPLIGGFVGGDTVAAVLSSGLHKQEGAVLLVDIGTNSEMALRANGRLYVASAAAGPAFEGGGITYGMTAAPGAIERVSLVGDDLKLKTIGDRKPVGICGSGLVDAVAALLDAGVMDKSGRVRDSSEVDTFISAKIRAGVDGNSVVLFKGPSGEVTLSQADVRNFQTAKAAIRAGIAVLMEKAGIKPNDIGAVYLAGAFGSKLDKRGLSRVGLLDSAWRDVVYTVGDAALDGAEIALKDPKAREEASLIGETARYVSLSGSPGFEREFIKNMGF
jgi:uncharacterized 2Fe-2S/4Fe-4S cluster protein (DUF4445 family)